MGAFVPNEEFGEDSVPVLVEIDAPGSEALAPPLGWTPYFRHPCTFGPSFFEDVMLNLIKNPNVNSSWLFRADILFDHAGVYPDTSEDLRHVEIIPAFQGCSCKRVLIRRLIPRNTLRDRPLDQTCIIYQPVAGQPVERSLVVYIPHVSAPSQMPFYHPKVRGIAFLHEWNPSEDQGLVSVSYMLFNPGDRSDNRLTRTALQLLMVLHKHGQGRCDGYVKRVHHDLLIPQVVFQTRYAALKQRYARDLVTSWAETTDPTKHVFEDLGIAAFLIELWAQMYHDAPFPGFVDIGCGNGLLVYILNREGYKGWGFDARARKSWAAYNMEIALGERSRGTLQQLVLLPSVIGSLGEKLSESQVHDGRFPKGTFIISNHADELTPWTPILATTSECPFVMIPCCSHDLTGSRYRAPPPKDKNKGRSAYASLVEWVGGIATQCGWEVETEMLRIPSTRNTALVGRRRSASLDSPVDINEIVRRHGGTGGYFENVAKLVKTSKEH